MRIGKRQKLRISTSLNQIMSQKLTTEEFIKKAREVHGDKYDYSKVEYVGTKTPIIIICKKHGKFQQIPQKHLTGQGCIKCHREAMAKRYSLGKEKFIEKSNAVHNGFYDGFILNLSK